MKNNNMIQKTKNINYKSNSYLINYNYYKIPFNNNNKNSTKKSKTKNKLCQLKVNKIKIN